MIWSLSFPHRASLLFFLLGSCSVWAQGNYEIQVYGSDTIAPGRTMVELHSNYTFEGFKTTVQGVLPDEHQLHETLEITQGWNDWFETGFYIFTSAGPNQGYKWVGDHIRPRVRVPERWHWPVGVSLSAEVGYQRPIFSADTWTWELRPIVDKQIGPWYFAFNPALEGSFRGPGAPAANGPGTTTGTTTGPAGGTPVVVQGSSPGIGFSPNVKIGYGFTRKLSGGLEYYGSLGDITGFDPIALQQHQIVPSIDYDFGPNWEFNFGVGVGVTHSTDHLLVKMIIGHRFRFITPQIPHMLKAALAAPQP